MANSPQLDAEGVVRVTVYSGGAQLAEIVQLISVTVSRAVNTVPSARLVFADGDMPRKEFPLSDSDDLKPGAEIKISAGYGDAEDTVFEGIVVKHGVRVSGNNDARLVIECRDKAVRMTVGRKNANYVGQKDSDIISKLASAGGLSADVDATDIQHGELVQHYSSDWDFVLARAEANGLLVVATDGALAVKAPATAGEPVLKVTYGDDLIDFQAEIDARTQFASAQAVSWDMKNQAVVLGSEAAPVTLNAQGDLDSATLAKVVDLSSFRLQTGAPLSKESLTQWAKALQLKAGLARIRGHMSFQGSAKAKVGELIELEGVGTRFSGKVFVTGLTHVIEDGNWTTQAEFGVAPAWFTERSDVLAPPAGGLLPAVEGLHVGVVMKLDEDPDGEQRIQVSTPVLQPETDGVWARLLKFHGSNGFGAFFLPEIGDEVVLGYFNNDPSHPVVLGSLYSSKHAPPYPLAAENNIKAIVTRCKSKIEFNEEDKVITVTTPGNNKIVLSDKDKSILLQDQNDNKVELNPSGITLDSPKDIKVTAKGTITLDAVGAVSISSKADVKTAGLNVNTEAQVGFVAKGNASAELSAAGQTVVKGAIVMIN
ncbi:type VI secretion system tip protein VgrG [Piscinibacter sp.]|uniref:type VI secretion system tip protein VgrG n=1 Tax=Piscinibacter sp. TaxID=1903157 RepID=UPI002CFD7D03|nr:type VI secretion system tip protein VgrG [Albitalea sp.]HUG26167.1 type VI secretion system tip protein VgrG [Albitalea sp.]